MRGQWMSWRICLSTALLAACLTAQAAANQAVMERTQKLLDEAATLYSDARLKEGMALAEHALALSEAALGAEHPQTAAALEHVARFTHSAGNFTRALQLCQQALAIREKALGPEHAETARSWHQLGDLQRFAGDYGSAEQLYQRAIAVREKVFGPEHEILAHSLHGLASLYWTTTSYANAEQLFRRALSIREKRLGKEHPDTVKTLFGLANVRVDLGDGHSAEIMLKRIIAVRQKILRPGHHDIGTALMSLGEHHAITGAYEEAIEPLKQALAIFEAGHPPEHAILANPLRSLAMVYSDIGSHAEAEPLMRRALAIYEKALPPDHAVLVMAIASLAMIHERLGDTANAASLYQRALAKIKTGGSAGQVETLWAQSTAATFYTTQRAYARAEQLHSGVLAHQQRLLGTRHPNTVATLVQLGMTQWAMGKPGAALQLLQRAQQARSLYSTRLLAAGPEARKLAYLRDTGKETFKLVSFSTATRSERSATLGLSAVLQHKGRALDVTSGGISKLRQSVDPADQRLFEQLTTVAAELSALIYQAPGALLAMTYQQRVAELEARQQALEAQIASRSSEFQCRLAPATVSAIRNAIPADAALIEWLRYLPFDPSAGSHTQWSAPRYVAYVLRRSGAPRVVDLGPAEDIERLARDFRRAASNSRRRDVRERAAALSDKLLAPLFPHLRGTTHLLLSPDGELNLVPMAPLLDEHGEYLIEKRELTYLSSGRDLLRFGSTASATARAERRIVIVADPTYGTGEPASARVDLEVKRSADLDRSGLIFRPLPATLREATALQRLLRVDATNMLLQANATETRVKLLAQPRILHIATHGFFLSDQDADIAFRPERANRAGTATSTAPENPLLRSGIALAGANARASGEDDGVLTALEVAQLDLRGTELVVLSACETGIGEVRNGEGVYGLRRALTLAGAQSHLTSLWRVGDTATQTLMVDYYQRLLEGAGRSAALRAAQRTLLATEQRSHPYYWAGFIPSGDWTPLRGLR